MISSLRRATIAVVPLLAATSATAGTGQQQRVAVELVFLWRGLPVLRMTIDATVDDSRYAVRTKSRALGLVWAFTRWTSVSSAAGDVAGKSLQPRRYLADSKFRSRKSRIELTYPSPGRTITRITPPEALKDWTTVPAALRQGAPDPLSTIVAHLRPGAANPCTWSGEVYDGRRRYRLTLRPDGEETLRLGMWNRYRGKAIRCKVVTKTLAGWHKDSLKDKDRKRPPATIWFARFERARMWLPVRLVAQTRWGEVRGELFKYKLTPGSQP